MNSFSLKDFAGRVLKFSKKKCYETGSPLDMRLIWSIPNYMSDNTSVVCFIQFSSHLPKLSQHKKPCLSYYHSHLNSFRFLAFATSLTCIFQIINAVLQQNNKLSAFTELFWCYSYCAGVCSSVCCNCSWCCRCYQELWCSFNDSKEPTDNNMDP